MPDRTTTAPPPPTATGPDVGAAARWLAGRVVRTPVVRAPHLDRIAGVELWLKAENLQRSGSYKFRGAMVAVGRLAADDRCAGLIAQSTGNHGLAVATAAAERNLPVLVVLPADACPTKVQGIRACGARVVFAGTTLNERLAAVRELRAATGYRVVDAYDDPDVIAGQGTATAELLDQAHEQGSDLDAVVVPVGGGGGVAGACLAVRGRGTRVFGVEPTGCDSLRRSLRAGRRIAVEPAATLADGLRPALVGELPFEISQRLLDEVLEVDDEAIGQALCLISAHTGMLVEPSAAAALAGALALAARDRFRRIGVVLTGGNFDPAVVAGVIARHDLRTRVGGPAHDLRTRVEGPTGADAPSAAGICPEAPVRR